MNLNQIQKELKAPKNQRNSFGNYNYRSCESILEAVKPMLGGSVLTLTDQMNLIGDRYYVEATAKFVDEDGKVDTTKASARESETKKGMDESQITGTASSYARKYALNGLFLIDDNKDADTDEFQNQKKSLEIEDQMTEKISTVMETRILNIMKLDKTDDQANALFKDFCKEFKIKKIADLKNGQYPEAVKWLEGK